MEKWLVIGAVGLLSFAIIPPILLTLPQFSGFWELNPDIRQLFGLGMMMPGIAIFLICLFQALQTPLMENN
jgi:hypothetical protein